MNIPSSILDRAVVESPSLREYIVRYFLDRSRAEMLPQAAGESLELFTWRQAFIAEVKANKIAAIKRVRENRWEDGNRFANWAIEVGKRFEDSNRPGLAEAKNFVEAIV